MSPLILLFVAVGIGLAFVAYLLLSEKGKTQGSTTMSANPDQAQQSTKKFHFLVHVLIGIGLIRAFVLPIIELRSDNPYAMVSVIISLAFVIIVWNFYKLRKWAFNALVVFLSVMILLLVPGLIRGAAVYIGLFLILLDGVTIILMYNHRVRNLF